MLSRFFLLVSLICIASLLSVSAQEDEHTKKFPEGEGRDLVVTVCRQCHGLAATSDSRHTLDGWERIVNDMVNIGAALDKQQAETVSQYLANNFGPNSDKSEDKK
ncbi:MAG: hypothetical protein HYX72_11075 [Acidobacteria bacterium]|nr:hypothetical protein [Acidobacteriota bacterium]